MSFIGVRIIALACTVCVCVHGTPTSCANGGTLSTKSFTNNDQDYCACPDGWSGTTCTDCWFSVTSTDGCWEKAATNKVANSQYLPADPTLSLESCAVYTRVVKTYYYFAVMDENICIWERYLTHLKDEDPSTGCTASCPGGGSPCGKTNATDRYSVHRLAIVDDDDDCPGNCHATHGQCVDGINTYTCYCEADWQNAGSGKCNQQIDNCTPDPCLNGATCVDGIDGYTTPGNPYSCTCDTWYNGTNCENLQECDTTVTALKHSPACDPTHGTCVDPGGAVNDSYCACAPDYTGADCATWIDNCSPNPCLNGGTCTDGIHPAYTCACDTNYNTSTCANLMECSVDPNYCNGNGQCVDGGSSTPNDHSCTCNSQWHGTTCNNYNECVDSPDPCNDHASSCIDLIDSPTQQTLLSGGGQINCVCSGGYHGNYCEFDYNECVETYTPTLGTISSCKTPGTEWCEDLLNARTCHCRVGWTGTTCETDIDECASTPCVSPGTNYCKDSGCGVWGTCMNSGQASQLCPDGTQCPAIGSRATYYSGIAFGAHLCECILGYVDDATQSVGHSPLYNCSYDFPECDSSPCVNGTCVEPSPNMWQCNCDGGFFGTTCSSDYNECQQNVTSWGTFEWCRSPGTDWCENLANDRACHCIDGWSGTRCETDVDECASNPCANGGTCWDSGCVTNPTQFCTNSGQQSQTCTIGYGTHHCLCVPGYVDDATQAVNHSPLHNCSHDFQECDSNPCQNEGTCSEPSLNMYLCACKQGWMGTNCEIDIDECASNPCSTMDEWSCGNLSTCAACPGCQGTGPPMYGSSTPAGGNSSAPNWCTNLEGQFLCTCTSGVTGPTCAVDIDECASSPCNDKDAGATCNNNFNGFTCTCTPDWTNPLCDLETFVYELMSLFGGGSFDVDITRILGTQGGRYPVIFLRYNTAHVNFCSIRDVISKSEVIIDSVPFLASTLNNVTKQFGTSWSHDQVFKWATYEGRSLDIANDFERWNDATLGNCFTFNFANRTTLYKARRAGKGNGLLMYLDVGQSEYAKWVDTVGYRVYIHNQSEGVYAETVSYAMPPGYYTQMGLNYVEYSRLGSPHGDCVTETSQVASYYYPGVYSAEGCIRSCYQNELLASECACMDPRYPQDPVQPKCQLSERGCVNDFVAEKGDPSKWQGCNCPLPCLSGEYQVVLTRAALRSDMTECHGADYGQGPNTICNDAIHQNNMLVEVFFNDMQYYKYTQTPKMGIQDLMSATGGILGILCGISVFSLFEIIFTLLQILFVAVTGRG